MRDKSEVPDLLGLQFSFHSKIAWGKDIQSLGVKSRPKARKKEVGWLSGLQ
jgi:hypothetical protein